MLYPLSYERVASIVSTETCVSGHCGGDFTEGSCVSKPRLGATQRTIQPAWR